MTKVYAVSEPDESMDPGYVAGLPLAVSVALKYGLLAIEQGESHAPTTPPILLSQARLAARNGVELDAVLRRYVAGYTLLSDFVAQEAAREELLEAGDAQRFSRDQAVLFEHLVSAVSEEHKVEAKGRRRSTEDRRVERIRRLLAGDLLDTSELRYEFEAWHIGTLAFGPKASTALRDLAIALDCRLLLIRSADGHVWAWLGRRQRVDSAALERVALAEWPSQTPLAIGEPGHGLQGWRVTHRQARAALPLAAHYPKSIIRYSDEPLLASMIQDDLLVASLAQLYLDPLAGGPDGGKALRETLRAYFEAERNVSSAAASLGVSRKTVTNRLGLVEKRVGRPLSSCATELEGALRLHELKALGESCASQFG